MFSIHELGRVELRTNEHRWLNSKTISRTRSTPLTTSTSRWRAISSSTSQRWSRASRWNFMVSRLCFFLVIGSCEKMIHEGRRLVCCLGMASEFGMPGLERDTLYYPAFHGALPTRSDGGFALVVPQLERYFSNRFVFHYLPPNVLFTQFNSRKPPGLTQNSFRASLQLWLSSF